MGLLILLGAGFVVFWTLLVALTLRGLLYPPRRTFAWCVSRGQPADPGALSPPRAFEEGSIGDPGRRGGSLPYWAIGGDEPAGPVVIFSHGWAESKQAVLQRISALTPVCSRIVAWDLPGHGEASPGPCRLGVDEHRALVALAEAFADRPVVLYGFSLGAGTSIRAAAAGAPVAGVIAEAPYRAPWTPARRVMEMRGMPHRLNLRPALALAGFVLGADPLWRRFDRAPIAAELRNPLLVVHAKDDEMCPIADGREIAAAAPDGRLVEIEGGTHLLPWGDETAAAPLVLAVRTFLAEIREVHACAEPAR